MANHFFSRPPKYLPLHINLENLTKCAIVTLWYIIDHQKNDAPNDPWTYPLSDKEASERIGYSPGSIANARAELIRKGFILQQRAKVKDGSPITGKFVFHVIARATAKAQTYDDAIAIAKSHEGDRNPTGVMEIPPESWDFHEGHGTNPTTVVETPHDSDEQIPPESWDFNTCETASKPVAASVSSDENRGSIDICKDNLQDIPSPPTSSSILLDHWNQVRGWKEMKKKVFLSYFEELIEVVQLEYELSESDAVDVIKIAIERPGATKGRHPADTPRWYTQHSDGVYALGQAFKNFTRSSQEARVHETTEASSPNQESSPSTDEHPQPSPTPTEDAPVSASRSSSASPDLARVKFKLMTLPKDCTPDDRVRAFRHAPVDAEIIERLWSEVQSERENANEPSRVKAMFRSRGIAIDAQNPDPNTQFGEFAQAIKDRNGSYLAQACED